MASATHAMDLRLVREAIGNPQALDEVAARLYPEVYQTVFLMAGGHQDAGDVAQACLLKILESLGSYRGDGPLNAWAGRLTYRLAIRQMKRIRASYRTVVPMDHEPGQDAAETEDEVHRAQLRQWLADHLAKLPPERRETVVLHHVYGYTMDEVGELMGVSPNTAKSRLLRATKDLRESVARDGATAEFMLEGIDG
jgi:RNA polymerase sigma-70 factor (ECF subfamily)